MAFIGLWKIISNFNGYAHYMITTTQAMTLVAIVTSGCIIKNFKCWQLGSIAWNTGRRAGKRQVWQKCTKQSGAWVLSVVPSLDREQWREPMAWIYQVSFLVFSQIIETEGGKAVFRLSYFLSFSRKKKRKAACPFETGFWWSPFSF